MSTTQGAQAPSGNRPRRAMASRGPAASGDGSAPAGTGRKEAPKGAGPRSGKRVSGAPEGRSRGGRATSSALATHGARLVRGARTTMRHPEGARARVLAVESVRLTSAFKMSLLLSVAAGIALVAGVALLWIMLNTMGVFSDVNQLVGDLVGAADPESSGSFSLSDYLGLGTALTAATVVAVINTVMFTIAGTALALLYNLISRLVGGLELELHDR